MKRTSPIAYRALFFKHVSGFLSLVESEYERRCPHAIGVSGGVDSMALLWFAQSLHRQGRLGVVRALFVHHHTRPTQEDDQELIRQFCEQEKIPFQVLHAQDLKPQAGNFEDKARRVRRELLLAELKSNELLWLGHHLDDSQEWTIMQRCRSMNLKTSLGIPVRNKAIVRPFLCVTKDQIRRLMKFEGIHFREDPTNLDLSYDRNYVRHKILPLIKKRYPKYLKHYAYFSNFMATTFHLNVANRLSGSSMYVFENGAVIEGLQFPQIQVQELIHTYSNTNRGEIAAQIVKMLKAIENEKKGPFHFSGGIEVYYSYHLLMIYKKGMRNHDHSISRVLARLTPAQVSHLPTFSISEIERTWGNLLKSPDAMLNMPGLVVVYESDSIRKVLNTSVYDSLFPETSQVCQNLGLRFTTIVKCIDKWKAKKSKLPERLRLLPLWTLSNLFSSQDTSDSPII